MRRPEAIRPFDTTADYYVAYAAAVADRLHAVRPTDQRQSYWDELAYEADERMRHVEARLRASAPQPYTALERISDAPGWLVAAMLMHAGWILDPRIPLPFVAGRGIRIEDAVVAVGGSDMEDDEMLLHVGREAPLVELDIIRVSGDRPDRVRSQYVMLTRGGVCAMLGCGPEHVASRRSDSGSGSLIVQDRAAEWRRRLVEGLVQGRGERR